MRHTLVMKVAGFKEKAHAVEAATVLREGGYEAELIGVDGERSPSRLGDLPDPVLEAKWANALLLSNCDSEHFAKIVADHYGMVLWQHRPGRFHRFETESPFGNRKLR